MSLYIKLSTFEYPRYEGNIRQEYPEIREDQTGTTFPCPDTYAQVEETPEPEVTDTQVVVEQPPEYINGAWKRVWLVRDATQQEIDQREANIKKLLTGNPIE